MTILFQELGHTIDCLLDDGTFSFYRCYYGTLIKWGNINCYLKKLGLWK